MPRKLRYAARLEHLEDRVLPATNVFLNVGPALTNIAAPRSATVPVFIDTGTLTGGAGGIQSATFYVRYDPAVLSINESAVAPGTVGSDIQLGSVLSSGLPAGTYKVGTATGFGPGIVGIGVTNNGAAFYTGTGGGHLVELDFHVLQSVPVSQSTLLDLVPTIPAHKTVVADTAGSQYTITPALGVYSGTSLSQAGALTPGTFNPADTDAGDAVIQVVAKGPGAKPTAGDDSFSMAPSTGVFPAILAVAAKGVLANDTDASGPMNAVLTGGNAITIGTATVGGISTTTYTQATAHGSVTLNAVDGSFTYTPAAGFTGSDSFTYQAVDAITNTAGATATVNIQVGGAESIPQNLTLDASSASNTVKVPVNIGNPNPAGSGGLVTAVINVGYDKTKLAPTGVAMGAVLKNAGWTSLVSNLNTPGQISISANGPAIQTTTGGDLVDITFKPVTGATNGPTVVNLLGTGSELDVAGTGTPLVLPFAVAPIDNPTTIAGATDGVITISGGASATTSTTTMSTANAAPAYGTPVTLTATVAPAAGTTAPTQGSVAFYINGNALLGAGTSAGTDANHDALFTYVTGASQLQVNGGAAQPVLAVYTAGAGFSSSTSTNSVKETVAPVALTVTGITASNKVYDATTKATLNTAGATLAGAVAGDALSLTGGTGTFASKDVGNGIAVAVSGLTVKGAQAANYTLTQPTTSANITPATLTVTGVKANDKAYDATKTTTLNTSAAALVGIIGSDVVTLNSSGGVGTLASKDVGSNIAVAASGLTLGGAQGGDYTLTQPSTTANITPAKLTVTGLVVNDKAYDTTTAATLTTSGAALAGLFAGDTVTLNTAAAKGVFASKDAGNGMAVTISGLTIGGAQAGDYTLTQPAPTANITPAPLNVLITAQDKVFDGTTKATLNAGTAAVTGLLGSDKVTLNVSGATGTFATKDVGAGIAVQVSGITITGGQAADYSVVQPTTTANITRAVLTVSGVKAGDKVYEGTTKAALDTSGAALVGLFGNDAVNLVTSSAAGAFASKDVGKGKTVSVSGLALSGDLARDYTLTQPTATANVTAATLTVTGISAKDRKYDSTTKATFNLAGATLAGVVSGDNVTLTGASGTFASKDVGSNIAVTITAVTLGGTQGGNYQVTPPTTALTANITQASLTVQNVTASNKVYDGTNKATLSADSAALAGVFAGDTVTLAKQNVSGTFPSKNVGSNLTVTVTGYSITGAQAGDYALTAPAPTASITAAPLTISGLAVSDKVYDGTPKATLSTTGVALTGVIAGETLTLSTSGATATFATRNVGKNIAVTLSGITVTGAGVGNYSLTLPALTANITQATLTVTGITAKDKVYDAKTQATLTTTGAALTGLVGGDTVTLNTAGATGTFASKDVGSAIKVTLAGLTLTGQSSAEYTLAQPAVTANITPKALTVTGITGKDKVYDGTTKATLSATGAAVTGVIAGDTVTLATAGATGTFASKDVGKSITVAVAGLTVAGSQAADYTITQPTTTANITPATVRVSGVTAKSKVYDGTTAATLNTANASLAGVIAPDAVTLNASGTGTFASKDAGNNITVTPTTLSLTGPQAGDYTLTLPGPLTANITPAPVTVTGVSVANKIYDKTTKATVNTLTFSTGNPDGLMAVGSRPSAGSDEIEAGDDFLLNSTTQVTSASFIGLLPTGTPLSSVSQVDVEIYRVFPLDSTNPPDGRVPTRTNSPSDNALDARDSALGTLTFSSTVLAPSFSAANSVLSGINASPKQTTGGEGKVTGAEVQFQANFVVPFSLPAGHYFFVPQVKLTSGNFLWLSAPKPIVAPGTAFTGDLQAWVRNSNLDPDWLRVGTDIVGGATPPTFNMSFTLTGSPANAADSTAGLTGVIAGDNVTVGTAGATATFASKDVGSGIAVTVSGLTIGGPQAGDYTLTAPGPFSANITPAPLTVTGLAAQDKVYDGTTTASINTSGAALVGVLAGDSVTLSTAGAVANFATKAVGQNISVQITGLSLSGPQAFDYTIGQATATANITPDVTVNLLTAAQGAATPLSNHLVQVDRASPADSVVYTVLAKPVGTLMDGTTKLDVGGSFTQADVNAGKVTYAPAAVGAESLQFSVTDGQGGTVPATTLHIIVVKNFTEPPIRMTDKSLLEGTTGLTAFTFTVNLPVGGTTTANGPVTYDVFTTDGTAKAGIDYIPIYAGVTGPNSSGTVTFAQGTSVATVTVNVKAGSFAPTKTTPSKNFTVSVANPNSLSAPLATATGTIIGQVSKPISTLPTPKITDASAVIDKSGLTPLTFSVDLGAAVAQQLTYDVFTTDGSAKAFTHYVGISPGANYPSSVGTVTFRPGTTHAEITVYAIGGSLAKGDGNKDFTLSLSDPLNSRVALASAKGVIIPNNLQVAIGTPDGAPGGVTLTALSQLAPSISAAEARWAAVGVPLSLFQGLRFTIAQLPDHELGNTYGRTINIDAGAAGFGWFIDPAPTTDKAFQKVSAATLQALPGSAAAGHMDLLTVLAHELGHILNLPDVISGPANLMTQGLTAGTRRLPTGSLLATAMSLPAVNSFSQFAPKVGKTNDDVAGNSLSSTDALASLSQSVSIPSSSAAAADQGSGQPWFAGPKNAPVWALLQVFADLGSETSGK
jgi:hypothetical protein